METIELLQWENNTRAKTLSNMQKQGLGRYLK